MPRNQPMRPWRALLWTLLLLVAGAPAVSAADEAPRQTVLVLSSVPLDVTGFQEAIHSALKAGAKAPIDIYDEYTGLDRFSGEAFEANLLRLYNEKYGRWKVDLILVVSPSALDFVVKKN